MVKIEWTLPTLNSRSTNEEIIHHNSKYHCFIDLEYQKELSILNSVKSICGRHVQFVGMYDSLESGEIAMRPEIACKACRKKWLKQFNVEY